MYNYYITPEEYKIAEKNGIDRNLLDARVRTLGWDKKKAMNKKVRNKECRKEWAEVARQNGIGYGTFIKRINRSKWSEEKAATRPIMSHKERYEYLTKKKQGGLK